MEIAILDLPAETPDLEIDADEIRAGTLRLVATEPPCRQLTLRYNRNYSPVARDSLAGILDESPAFAERLTQEWVQVVATNAVVGHLLPVTLSRDTFLVEQSDAQAECDRRAALQAVTRQRWELECFLAPAQVRPGQTVRITGIDMGWEVGRNAVVLSARPVLTRGLIRLEVWL